VHCPFDPPFIGVDPPFIVPFVGALGGGWCVGATWPGVVGCADRPFSEAAT
jgi:hypothetical protein